MYHIAASVTHVCILWHRITGFLPLSHISAQHRPGSLCYACKDGCWQLVYHRQLPPERIMASNMHCCHGTDKYMCHRQVAMSSHEVYISNRGLYLHEESRTEAALPQSLAGFTGRKPFGVTFRSVPRSKDSSCPDARRRRKQRNKSRVSSFPCTLAKHNAKARLQCVCSSRSMHVR